MTPVIPGFNRLSFNAYICQPEKRGSNTTDPDLILLHTWLNALPKHIAKYALLYRKLYPNSTLILTTSSWKDFSYRSIASQGASLAPVIEYILSIPPTSKILLCLFSNGGAWTASKLAVQYKRKTGRPLPVSKMVLDSSPGKGGYWITTTAFAVMLPSWRTNPFARLAGLITIHVGFCIAFLVQTLLRREEAAIILRRRLNDKTLFNEAAPRLYIFGDRDDMIPSNEVIEHAVWAKAIGFKVIQERYKDSGHVMHAVVDSERYWGAVERLWEGTP